MRETIESKLGCTIEEYGEQMLNAMRGIGDFPQSLNVLTDEEWDYMKSELVQIYGNTLFHI